MMSSVGATNKLGRVAGADGKFRRIRVLRRFERFFFVTGLLLVGLYAAAIGYSRFSQSYYDWSFDRLIHGKSASLFDYVGHFFEKEDVPVVDRAPLKMKKTPLTLTPGAPIGRLEIPSVGLSVMVLEGTDRWTLTKAAGHVEGTALPGKSGNFAVAAHRDSFFRPLKDITKDDAITFTTVNGSYQYRVERTRVVAPSNTSVLRSSDHGILTMITCYPFYYVGHAPKRFIVEARLIGETEN